MICDRIVWQRFAGWLLLAASLAVAGEALASAKVGEPAPDFELQRLTGGTVALSEFRGKVVLLNFLGYN